MSERERASTITLPVHPNSTAARKWKRRSWSVNLWVEAAHAQRAGDGSRARALRRRAATLDSPERTFNCG
jgi:hypothetical protein